MGKHGVVPGALFAIPGGNVYGLAKVIFVSEYYQNVMLVRLFRDRSVNPTDLSAPNPADDSALYYTGTDSVTKGGWVSIGKQAVESHELAMTKRVSGGEIWIEDTHLGSASDADLKSLKSMDVYGYRLIAKAVAKNTTS